MKQFEVPNFYRSELISDIKEKRKQEDKLKKDFAPTLLDYGKLQIYLARHCESFFTRSNLIPNCVSDCFVPRNDEEQEVLIRHS